MVILINEHVTDTIISGKNTRRKISSWQNYRLPDGRLLLSSANLITANSIPDNWAGNFDFKKIALNASCQSFVEDVNDPDNSAMWGLRRSDRPDCWVNFKAIDGNQNKTETIGNKTTWHDLWNNTNFSVCSAAGSVHKAIILKSPGHPKSFGFSMSLAPGLTYKCDNGVIRIYAEEEEVLFTKPIWAEDSTVAAIAEKQKMRCELMEGEPVGKYPTFWIELNAEDLSKATYPVTIDPTTTISGTTAIEDSPLSDYLTDNFNYGGQGYGPIGTYAGFLQVIMRIDKTLIPAGSITEFRVLLNSFISTGPVTTNAFIIKNANTWVEGNSVDADEPGAVCWNYCKTDTQYWAGSYGCSVSGTDYDADADPPEAVFQSEWNTLVLKNEWATAWRDSTRTNNGIIINALAAGENTYNYVVLSETNPYSDQFAYFEIDYEAAPAASSFIYFKLF